MSDRDEVAEVLADREALATFLWQAATQDGPPTMYFRMADALRPLLARREAEARAEAWDHGKIAGKSVTMRRMSDEPAAPEPENPYRAALAARSDQGAKP